MTAATPKHPLREALDAVRLQRDLIGVGSVWTRVEVVEQTLSTNADVAKAARHGAPEGLVVAAEHQVAGRGRLGRSWQATARSGLTVSALLRPVDVTAVHWPWLPLLTGVAVHRSLTAVARVPARLKWPNDVLIEDRKVAGILVERVDTPDGPAAVVGIGVNVWLDSHELPVPEATSLCLASPHPLDRTTLLVDILSRLGDGYATWRGAAGDASKGLRAAYERGCGTLGRDVAVSLPDGASVVGRATGIDAAGRLRVDTGETTRAVGAGDVVHLRSGS